jgi:hypothetical protein
MVSNAGTATPGGIVIATPQSILDIEPRFQKAVDGSWLAFAGPDAPVRVGVMEATHDDARLRFTEALQRVATALQRDHHSEEACD